MLENVDHLDPVKVDHDPATGAAGHILHLVSLQRGLNVPHQSQEWNHHVEAGTRHALKHDEVDKLNETVSERLKKEDTRSQEYYLKHGATPEVYSNMTFLYFVDRKLENKNNY